MAWVKWDESLLPYDEGGLNIGSLRGENLALLGKWFWRAKTEPNALWVSIIKSIHGTNGLLSPLNPNGSQGASSSVWSNIVRAGNMIEKLDINFACSFSRIIGNGADTDFWNSSWLCNQPLKQKFRRLYHMESEQHCSVQDRVKWIDGRVVTNWNWQHQPTGRTLSEFEAILHLLNTYVKQDKALDSWAWNLAANGCFTTKKLSSIIDDKILGNRFNLDETIKNNLVLIKVFIFIWRVLKRRIPVRTELDKRGIDLDSVRCPLCDDDVETIDHSIFFCQHAMDIWVRVYKWWGLGAVTNLSINEAFQGNCNRTLTPLWTSIW
ncbi:uncharacterized protein [Rutidosis leptorrhynchoides]|uniref:uncharacterized protein n=1 Tax=Rutidosis leptorrhynchoides TaxID=125765 RepID=UPI003A9A6057